MQLRSLGPHEVALHRDIRLRALQEAPDAFGEAFEDAAARPSSYWEELTRSVTERESHAMFLACEAQDVLGSTYALRDRDHGDVGRVGGMWVDPAWRRRGVGGALLQHVFGWARQHRMGRLRLSAPAHRPAALSLYGRAGFPETGIRRPFSTNPARQIVEMEASV